MPLFIEMNLGATEARKGWGTGDGCQTIAQGGKLAVARPHGLWRAVRYDLEAVNSFPDQAILDFFVHKPDINQFLR